MSFFWGGADGPHELGGLLIGRVRGQCGVLFETSKLDFFVQGLIRNRPSQNTFGFVACAGPKASTKLEDESRRWR